MIKYFILVLIAWSSLGCQALNRSEYKTDQKSVVLAFTDAKANLDWHKDLNMLSEVLVTNLMEGLVDYSIEQDQKKIVPVLAESWEERNGGTQLVVKIKNNVKWSDGKEVTADQFLLSFKRLLSPETDSPHADGLFPVLGAKEFHEGKIVNFEEVGIKAPQNKTLIFSLKFANPKFIENLAHFSTYPLRTENIEFFKGVTKKYEQVPWLGPFKTVFLGRRKIQLKNNKNYRQPVTSIEKIDVLFDLKKEKLLKMLKDKKADLVFGVDQIKFKNTVNYKEPLFDYFQLTLNSQRKPLSNPILRRVIGLSINKQDLARLYHGAQTLGGVIPPGVTGYESNRGMRYDPDMAALVLKNAYMTNELKKFEYDLYIGRSTSLLSLAEIIKDQLKKNLEMEIKIVQSSFDPKSTRPSMTLERVRGKSLNPLWYLSLFGRHSDTNKTGWKNLEYDEYLRRESLARAQHLLVEEENPVIPLFTMYNDFTTNDQVKGVKFHSMNYLDLKSLIIERK